MTQPVPSSTLLAVGLVFAVVLPPLGLALGLVARAQLAGHRCVRMRVAKLSVAISSVVMIAAFLVAAMYVLLLACAFAGVLLGVIPL